MRYIKIAFYEAPKDQKFRMHKGYSRINRYHWEEGFDCYIVDCSDDYTDGIFVNGRICKDYYQLRFKNYKGDVVRTENFESRAEANNTVKYYLQHKWVRIS